MSSIYYHPDPFNLFWQKDITLHFSSYMLKNKEIPLRLFVSIPEEVRCVGKVPYWEGKVENLAEFRKCIEHSINVINQSDLWEFLVNEGNT